MSIRKIFKSREELDKYKEKNPLLSIEYIVTKESGDVVVSFTKSSRVASESKLKEFTVTYDVVRDEYSSGEYHSFTIETKDKESALRYSKIEINRLMKAHKVRIVNMRIKENTLTDFISKNGKSILRLYERLLSDEC